MWHTPEGDRVLKGAEARLVRASLCSLLRIIDEGSDDLDDNPLFGVAPFDELEQGQRLVLVDQVSSALLREDVPPVPLTAVAEATVCLLYLNVMNEIEFEIEREAEYYGGVPCRRWRRLVTAASYEAELGEVCDRSREVMREIPTSPQPPCIDITEWDSEVSGLCDLVCGDRDWQLADDLLDQSPEVAQQLKAQLGIDDDYFTAVVPLQKRPIYYAPAGHFASWSAPSKDRFVSCWLAGLAGGMLVGQPSVFKSLYHGFPQTTLWPSLEKRVRQASAP